MSAQSPSAAQPISQEPSSPAEPSLALAAEAEAQKPSLWNAAGKLPEPLSGLDGFMYKDRIYVLGGSNGRTATTSVRYATLGEDGQVGEWTETIPLPQARTSSLAVLAGSRIYVLAGFTDNGFAQEGYFADIQPNGRVSTWNTVPLPISSGMTGAGTIAYGDYVYLLGGTGHDCSAIYASAYYAKSCPTGLCHPLTGDAADPWASTSALPREMNHIYPVMRDGEIYLIGGNLGVCSPPTADTVYRAQVGTDGALSKWEELSRLPAGSGGSGPVLSGEYAYYVGGGSGNHARVWSSRFSEDGRLGPWKDDASDYLPSGRSNALVQAYGGRIWVFGGTDDKGEVHAEAFSRKSPFLPPPPPLDAAQSPDAPKHPDLEILTYEVTGANTEESYCYAKIYADGKLLGQTETAQRSRPKRWLGTLPAGNHPLRIELWDRLSTEESARRPEDQQPRERFVRVEPGTNTKVELKLSDSGRRYSYIVTRE
jgi:N-acetylneuraminic acid mutarotase